MRRRYRSRRCATAPAAAHARLSRAWRGGGAAQRRVVRRRVPVPRRGHRGGGGGDAAHRAGNLGRPERSRSAHRHPLGVHAHAPRTGRWQRVHARANGRAARLRAVSQSLNAMRLRSHRSHCRHPSQTASPSCSMRASHPRSSSPSHRRARTKPARSRRRAASR